MLIANHTRQIYVPYGSVNCIVLQYVNDDLNDFYKNEGHAEGDQRERPVEITVVSNGDVIKFSERYGSKAKADAVMDGLMRALTNGHSVYALPLDEEYIALLKEIKAKKKAEAEQQKPAYMQGGGANGKK